MQRSFFKYPCSIAKRVASCLVVLCVSLITQAQDYSDTLYQPEAPDATTVTDTVVSVKDQDESPKYFKNRNDAGAGIEPFTIRHIPNDKMRSMRKDPDFWYADSSFKNGEEIITTTTNGPATADSIKRKQHQAIEERKQRKKNTFNLVVWLVVIAGFLTFLVIFLGNSNVRIFKRSRRIDEDIPEEENTEDIFAINYQKEIDKAAANQNYRLAIRLMFLRTLKDMSQKNIIQYRPDRTNLDYLMQVHSSIYYNDFFRITRNYEFAWYGKVDVSEQAYAQVKQDFENFHPNWTS